MSPRRAMWVRLGCAYRKLVLALGRGLPARCAVQTPLGPRKSGMPHAVEMPAPVNATTLLAARTCQHRRLVVKVRAGWGSNLVWWCEGWVGGQTYASQVEAHVPVVGQLRLRIK